MESDYSKLLDNFANSPDEIKTEVQRSRLSVDDFTQERRGDRTTT